MTSTLPTRILPRTDLALTELAFGTAPIGNLYTAISDADATAAVAAGWERGIRYFDTAPHYGLGLAERRLGAALAAYPREEVVISTKVGRLLVPNENPTEFDDNLFVVPGTLRREWDFSYDGVMRSVEDSLERLGTDYIDILYVHDPDDSGIEGAAELGANALLRLRDEGVVRAVGVGTNKTATVADLFRRTDIDVAMLAGRYTLLNQHGADDVFAAADGRGVVAVSVFNSGILATPRPLPGARYDYAPAPAEILEEAEALADAAERHGVTLPQIALAFPLRDERVTSVALGMRSAADVRENAALLDAVVPPALWSELREGGRIA